MKTRYDLLYDLAARLGSTDVADAELVFERLRADGWLSFDDQAGYRLGDGVDLLAAYELAIAERSGDLFSARDTRDDEHDIMSAWLFAIDGHPSASLATRKI